MIGDLPRALAVEARIASMNASLRDLFLAVFATSDLDIVRANIVVRNAHQHRDGVVLSDALRKIGKDGGLIVMGDDNVQKTTPAGESYSPSLWEVIRCMDAMKRLATSLTSAGAT